MILVYTPGSNIENFHFMCKTFETNPAVRSEKSQPAIEEAKRDVSIYHTRAMRRAVFQKFGLVSSSVKPMILQYFYQDLTGDQSASATTEQSYIDKRIREIMDIEDSDVVLDLGSENSDQESQ
ncbi:PREDICTED: uncharacterized protein LOC109584906 [Amphimedon queenslandica]|uniref:Uncharacterized protein n=2 Tax=Amphimedon queenslandica TaxID=400682 RepID=A0AAN0JH70_AMPQE|nr:PREDICTED: uncharacterized protein LOC109584906 [Amphimedon queenslandica]|eukprot:XP_019856375.1 PREDICTED: uncharacterized protein LOC109584906 [Amphimedon queenslandica]